MAEERIGASTYDSRKTASWTNLLRTFLVALDPFKLLVAAFGVLATAFGWWLLSVVFYYSWSKPRESDYDAKYKEVANEQERYARKHAEFNQDFARWAMIHQLAGPTTTPDTDFAKWLRENNPAAAFSNPRMAEGYGGKYRTMPWFEDRGPNPYILTTSLLSSNSTDRKEILGWFFSNQVPVLVEPLIKFLSPILGMFDSRANGWVRFYLFLVLLWTLVVWAFAGGVITRMAIMQLAQKEGGGLKDSIKFVFSRYWSYLFSPIVPLAFIFVMVICCIVFGFLHMIPAVGEIIFDGLLIFLPILAGFFMALTLVGMVGYPLMYTTLSAEGSDTFDSLSRSYNYVYESPWSYLWYSIVAITYGAILVFFVVFMSSLAVYLSKWGVTQTPWLGERRPDYLYINAPTSFGWREVMLQNSPVAIDERGNYLNTPIAEQYLKEYTWYNHAGAGMVGFWLTLLFMLTVGFGYSYFWTASSMVYLLMRKKVDETEIDEVYTEEENLDAPAPTTTATSQPPVQTAPVSIPIDPPTLRTPPTPPAPPVYPPTPPAPPVTPPTPPVVTEKVAEPTKETYTVLTNPPASPPKEKETPATPPTEPPAGPGSTDGTKPA